MGIIGDVLCFIAIFFAGYFVNIGTLLSSWGVQLGEEDTQDCTVEVFVPRKEN